MEGVQLRVYPVMSEQVATFEGRAAVPLTSILGGFRKLFFLQPRTFDLYGRVQVDLPCAATPLGATAQKYLACSGAGLPHFLSAWPGRVQKRAG